MASRFEGRRGSRTIMMGRIHMGNTSLGSLLAALLAAGSSAMAADVTPQRLAINPRGNYFWLSCETATANARAARAVPAATRELVRVYSCLHRQ